MPKYILVELNSAGGKQEAKGCGVFSWRIADGVVSDVNCLGQRWASDNASDGPGKVSDVAVYSPDDITSIYFPLTSCGQSRTALDEQ